jgi:hypothetical protein
MIGYRFDSFNVILSFDDLIHRPAETLEKVFTAMDLPMIEGALAAYDKPRSMKGNKIMDSHKESWSSCERPNISSEEAAEIVAIWRRLGYSFESPDEYASFFSF